LLFYPTTRDREKNKETRKEGGKKDEKGRRKEKGSASPSYTLYLYVI
jgi:hypothetical protein